MVAPTWDRIWLICKDELSAVGFLLRMPNLSAEKLFLRFTMMTAMQNASPFAALPDGAPADVDIEFTFDYNVFHGGGRKFAGPPIK